MGRPPLKTGPPVGFFLLTSFQSEETLSNSFKVSLTVILPPLALDATEAALWYSPLIYIYVFFFLVAPPFTLFSDSADNIQGCVIKSEVDNALKELLA